MTPKDDLHAVATRIAAEAPNMPLQRAIDRSFEGLERLRVQHGFAWRVVVDALAAAGVYLPSGGLISEREIARLYSRAVSKRKLASLNCATPAAVTSGQIREAPDGASPAPQGGEGQGVAPPDTPAVKGGAPLNNPPGMPEGVGTETAFQRVQRERAERDARQAGKPSLDPWDK